MVKQTPKQVLELMPKLQPSSLSPSPSTSVVSHHPSNVEYQHARPRTAAFGSPR